MSNHNVTHDVGVEAFKASPAITVAAMTLGGVSLQDWVLIAALIYTILQICFLIWKWIREWRRGKLSADAPEELDE